MCKNIILKHKYIFSSSNLLSIGEMIIIIIKKHYIVYFPGWKKGPSGSPGQVDFLAGRENIRLTCQISKGLSK